MADKVVLMIDLTLEDRQRIEELAQRRGYSAASDYLLALVELDEEEFDEKEALLDDLRQSIHEAMTGQTIPASELRAALDDEE